MVLVITQGHLLQPLTDYRGGLVLTRSLFSEPYVNLSAHMAPAMEPRRTPICHVAAVGGRVAQPGESRLSDGLPRVNLNLLDWRSRRINVENPREKTDVRYWYAL